MDRLLLLFFCVLMQYLAAAQPGPRTCHWYFRIYDKQGNRITPDNKDYQVLTGSYAYRDKYLIEPAGYTSIPKQRFHKVSEQVDSSYYAATEEFFWGDTRDHISQLSLKYFIIRGADTMVIHNPASTMDHIIFHKGHYYPPRYIGRYYDFYQKHIGIQLANDYNLEDCDWELLKHPNITYIGKVADAMPDTASAVRYDHKDVSHRWFKVSSNLEDGLAYSLGFWSDFSAGASLIVLKQNGKYALFEVKEAVDTATGSGYWNPPVFLLDTVVFSNGHFYAFGRSSHWSGSFQFYGTGWYKLHIGLKRSEPRYDCLRLKYHHDRYEEFEEFYMEWQKKEPEYDYVKENMKESRMELKALGMQFRAQPCD